MPTPEIVWWRAQMRARQEAARKAARPILFTQALAIAALIGLLVSVARPLDACRHFVASARLSPPVASAMPSSASAHRHRCPSACRASRRSRPCTSRSRAIERTPSASKVARHVPHERGIPDRIIRLTLALSPSALFERRWMDGAPSQVASHRRPRCSRRSSRGQSPATGKPSITNGEWPDYSGDLRGLALLAARSNQRVEFQSTAGRVAIQDRQSRPAPRVQARRHAGDGQGHAVYDRRHTAIGHLARRQDRRAELGAQPARRDAARRSRRGSCRAAASGTGPTAKATSASST